MRPVPFSTEIEFEVCDAIQIAVSQDIHHEEIVFKVEMPAGSYLVLGFGASLEDCDVLLF